MSQITSYAIMRICENQCSYKTTGPEFTTDVERTASFPDYNLAKEALNAFTAGHVYADEQSDYSIVPSPLQDKVSLLKALPPPDFFEVGEPTSARHIIEILSAEHFSLGFTPVDNITGAGQMTSNLGTDLHDDRAVGRLAKFSFPGWMEISEIELLRESAIRHKQWKNCRVVNRGNGFAKWFIVVLSAELK